MIVPSMTLDEIHKELYSDFDTLESTIDNFLRDFKRKVLKASRYPVYHTYDCRTRLKKNLFVFNLYASKRGDWAKPLIGICAIYNRPDGNYLATLAIDKNMTTIYPPHFFIRYRKRIVKDMMSSIEDTIKLYLHRNRWGFVAAPSDEKYQGLYNIFEAEMSGTDISFVCVNSEGFCFGEKLGNINVMKTIISEDMLFDDQRAIFAKLKGEFELFNKSMFGTRYSG